MQEIYHNILFIYLCIYLFIFVCMYLFMCLSIYLFMYLFIYLFMILLIYLFIFIYNLHVYIYIMYVYIYISFFTFIVLKSSMFSSRCSLKKRHWTSRLPPHLGLLLLRKWGRTQQAHLREFHKWGYPEIIHFRLGYIGIFHYKQTMLGYHHSIFFWKPRMFDS